MEGLRTYQLGELLSIPIRNGLTKPSSIRGKGVKMIGMGELFSNDIIRAIDMPRVPVTDTELRTASIEKGDLLFARQSLVLEGAGKCSIVKEIDSPTVFESHLIRCRINSSLALPEYIYYYFKSREGRHNIESIVEQVAAAGIRGRDLVKLSITIPSIEVQRRIVDILLSFDEKIEINNRINHNLEEQAQALFKSWFVDFEPFKDGEFVDSEFGYIPNGWRLGKLSELVEVRYGKDHKFLKDGRIPVYGSGGLMRYADRALFESESVLIPRKGTLSNVMYVDHPFWTVDTMFYTIGKIEHVIKYAHLFLLTQDLASMNAGSAVPSMTTDILNKLPVLIPTYEVLRDFDAIVSALYLIIGRDRAENASLASSRDSILPKLMSGAIDFNTLNC